MSKLTDINQLRLAAQRTVELSAQIATATAEAIEEIAGKIITMEQVNTAIDAKITDAIESSY